MNVFVKICPSMKMSLFDPFVNVKMFSEKLDETLVMITVPKMGRPPRALRVDIMKFCAILAMRTANPSSAGDTFEN
jgi:hypothetical protein